MAISLGNLISVSSTVADAAVKAANFGTLAIFTHHTNFVGWRSYTADADGLAAMIADGFDEHHTAYQLQQAIASQSQSVLTIKHYACANEQPQSLKLTPTNVTDGFVYRLEVNGTEITHTNDSDDVESICDALTTAIDALTGISVTDNTTDIDVDADDRSSVSIALKTFGPELTVKAAGADGGFAADFAAAQALDNGFYGVLTDCVSEAQLAVVATAVETAKKLHVVASIDSDIATSASTDLASDLKTASRVRTAVIATRDGAGRVDAGLLGRQLSFNPGSSNYNWQRISGATPDSFTQSEYDYVRGKNAGVYAYFAAAGADEIGITQHVKGASGRFLDITRGVDWLEANLGAAIAQKLLEQEVIPNTAVGRAMIEQAMSQVFKRGERIGLLTSNWSITIPTKAEQTQADRVARILRDVKYQAELSGALDSVIVQGTLTL